MNLRNAVLDAWGVAPSAMYMLAVNKGRGPVGRVKTLGTMLRYGLYCGRMSCRTTKVDVDGLVKKWVGAVVGMCLAHDKDQFDAEDAKADELMGPILTAPIAQVRVFYQQLRDTLKSTKEVPFLVWMSFEAWGEVVVDSAVDDVGIKRLKNKLAGEIADLVEMPVRDQIPEAIKRALRWRDPEVLKEVKSKLESGAKPKLVGRQSCLFMELGRGKNKTSVML